MSFKTQVGCMHFHRSHASSTCIMVRPMVKAEVESYSWIISKISMYNDKAYKLKLILNMYIIITHVEDQARRITLLLSLIKAVLYEIDILP